MLELLREYNGRNPHILRLKEKYDGRLDVVLRQQEVDYLSRNLRYIGRKINLTLKIGNESVALLNKQGFYCKNNEIIVDYLWGETDKLYHFGWYNDDFFVWKHDTDDVQKKELSVIPYNGNLWESLGNVKIYDFQVDGIKFMFNKKKCFNFDEPGCGKTLQSIIAAKANGCKNVLVITLASLKLNWKREVGRFGWTAKILNGKEYEDKQTDFTIINYEILKNFVPLHDFQIRKSLKNGKKGVVESTQTIGGFDCIIIDEVHRAKHPDALQSMCIKNLCSEKSVKCVYGLSGTPIEYNLDFYNICRSLDLSIPSLIQTNGYFGEIQQNYEEYAMTYCNAFEMRMDGVARKKNKEQIKSVLPSTIQSHRRIAYLLTILEQCGHKEKKEWYYQSPKGKIKLSELTVQQADEILKRPFEDKRKKTIIIGKKENGIMVKNSNTLELHQRIKHLMIRRTKRDVLHNFPYKFILPIYCSFDALKRLEYNSLWEEYLEEKNNKKYLEEDKLSSSIKIREFLAKLKVPHTINFVKDKIENGSKVIVFTHFKDEFELLCGGLKDCAVNIHASMTPEKKQSIIDKFQNDEKTRCIIGNIKTLGTGHNLTKGDIAVINSPNWNSGEHEQAEDRNFRIGREEDVEIYYMIFENTHEEEVFDRSRQKMENKQQFFG